jgi:cyclophilin family peptidyl-prolyl cis-trans isomerase/HEAT repeat protein
MHPKWIGSALFLLPAMAMAGLDPVTDAADRLDPAAPALLAAARSPQAAQRARAAEAYGRIQKPACVDPLLGLARDGSAAVREGALFALGQLAWKAGFAAGREAEIVAAIAPLLGESDRGVRLAAIEAIGKLGMDRAPDLLMPLLTDPDGGIREEGLLGLFRYRFVFRQRNGGQTPPPLPQPVLERMLLLARDPRGEVRRALVYGFARFKDERALSLATALADDPDEWTRLFSLLALTKIADPSAAAAVEAQLHDRSANVRRAAVQAAAAVGWAEAAALLRHDPDLHVRAAVAEALAGATALPSDPVPAWLRELAGDCEGEVRAEGTKALASRLKGGARDDLRAALCDRAESVRAAAVEALSSLPSGDRETLLPIVFADDSIAVRCALLALVAVDPRAEALALIEKELSSGPVDVRAAAITALTSRKERRALDLAWKAYLENQGMRLVALREAAVEALAASDGEASNARLREVLRDPAYAVAAAAHQVLVKRAVRDFAPPEEVLTFSPYRDLAVPERPVLTLETTKGMIEIVLYRDLAPVHVANAVGLVRKGFFDGKTWQRVVPNFVIQGGSPSLLGSEGQEWLLRAEVNRARFGRGAVGMSRGDLFGTGDSEFFVDHVPAPHLDGQYTCFGEVVRGRRVLDRIEAGDLILRATCRESGEEAPSASEGPDDPD